MPRPKGYKIYLAKEDLDLCVYLLDKGYNKTLICDFTNITLHILNQSLIQNGFTYNGKKGRISKEQNEEQRINISKDIDEYKKNNTNTCNICYDRSEYYKSSEFVSPLISL